MSTPTTPINESIEDLKREFLRRQGMVDVAYEQLDCATSELEEIHEKIVELLQLVDTEGVPTLDKRRGPKGKPITWQGKTLSILQWSQLTGIRPNTIYLRIKRGWSTESVLTKKDNDSVKEPSGIIDHPTAPLRTSPPSSPPETSPPPAAPIATEETPPRSAVEALPSAAPIPQPKIKPRVSCPQEVAGDAQKPSPKEASEDDEEDGASEQLATTEELQNETRRQQGGQKQRHAHLKTSSNRNHRHAAQVDFFGEGQTEVDSSGHVHRVSQFLIRAAHGHSHQFTRPE